MSCAPPYFGTVPAAYCSGEREREKEREGGREGGIDVMRFFLSSTPAVYTCTNIPTTQFELFHDITDLFETMNISVLSPN